MEQTDTEPQETPAKASARQRPSSPKWETTVRERIRASVRKFQRPLADLITREANEADTRLLVTDFLCDTLGFDKYTDLSTEFRVKNEYADYGLRLEGDLFAFLEVKRVGTKLGTKHLRQVQSYAVNEGVEWIILTNAAQWQVYHLSGGLPIIMDLVMEIDLIDDDAGHKAQLFYLTREAFKKGKLAELWLAKRATSPKSLKQIILSPSVIEAIRKELKKTTGYNVSPDEVATLVARTCLLTEA